MSALEQYTEREIVSVVEPDGELIQCSDCRHYRPNGGGVCVRLAGDYKWCVDERSDDLLKIRQFHPVCCGSAAQFFERKLFDGESKNFEKNPPPAGGWMDV